MLLIRNLRVIPHSDIPLQVRLQVSFFPLPLLGSSASSLYSAFIFVVFSYRSLLISGYCSLSGGKLTARVNKLFKMKNSLGSIENNLLPPSAFLFFLLFFLFTSRLIYSRCRKLDFEFPNFVGLGICITQGCSAAVSLFHLYCRGSELGIPHVQLISLSNMRYHCSLRAYS